MSDYRPGDFRNVDRIFSVVCNCGVWLNRDDRVRRLAVFRTLLITCLGFALCGEAQACQRDEFLAEVIMWGESTFAGVVFSRCARDAEVTLRVRLSAERAVWIGSTKVVVRAYAHRATVFDGRFPASKIARANPRFNSTHVLNVRVLPEFEPAQTHKPGMPVADFMELAHARTYRPSLR
ncbi:MAG: hypothetical protein WDZ63_10220 [Burkholderiales bacterium]